MGRPAVDQELLEHYGQEGPAANADFDLDDGDLSEIAEDESDGA